MTKLTLHIQGMTCSGCQQSIHQALIQLEGVEKVDVSLTNHTATIEHHSQLSAQDLINAIEAIGFDAHC